MKFGGAMEVGFKAKKVKCESNILTLWAFNQKNKWSILVWILIFLRIIGEGFKHQQDLVRT